MPPVYHLSVKRRGDFLAPLAEILYTQRGGRVFLDTPVASLCAQP